MDVRAREFLAREIQVQRKDRDLPGMLQGWQGGSCGWCQVGETGVEDVVKVVKGGRSQRAFWTFAP